MDKRTSVLLGTLVLLALCALGDADASGSQVPVDPLYQGLPPQEPNSVPPVPTMRETASRWSLV